MSTSCWWDNSWFAFSHHFCKFYDSLKKQTNKTGICLSFLSMFKAFSCTFYITAVLFSLGSLLYFSFFLFFVFCVCSIANVLCFCVLEGKMKLLLLTKWNGGVGTLVWLFKNKIPQGLSHSVHIKLEHVCFWHFFLIYYKWDENQKKTVCALNPLTHIFVFGKKA